MRKDKFWNRYSELDNLKAERREKKKRKRIPQTGKSVFRILRLKREK